MRLRLCFAGTPAFAAQHLSCLLENNYHLIAVYTQPDRPSGRGRELRPSPVKEIATRANIPVHQPVNFDSETARQTLRELAPDLLVVVAYGLILPRTVLDIPRHGGINVHASLLPRWRGAAPIERAILAGDKVTGISIMQLETGLDSGPILHSRPVAIASDEDRLSLTEKLSKTGQRALLFTLEHLTMLRTHAVPQDDDHATYAAKLAKSECLIDWTQSAAQIGALIRASVGRSPAFTFLHSRRLRILQGNHRADSQGHPVGTVVAIHQDHFVVQCHNSSLAVTRVQWPGRKPMAVRDVLHADSQPIQIGARFSNTADQ